jgi:hypothetical protein
MCFQRVMGLVVVFLHGGFFKRAIHAFPLTIRPWMTRFGEPVVDAILLADAIEDVREGIPIALLIGELDTVIGQHRVDLVGHGGDPVTQELCGYCLVGVRRQLGIGKLADTIDGDKQIELAFCRATSAMSKWK